MIDQSLHFVVTRLNAHLAARYGVQDDLVILSPLSDAEGKPAPNARNRLVVFLTNISRDVTPRSPKIRPTAQGLPLSPLHLDVFFIFASAYEAEHYQEGLKLLSAALMYFQANPVNTRQSAPEMPHGLDQLSIEISNLRAEDIGHLWGNLGGHYVPSVMFKMRSVIIDAAAATSVVPLITPPVSGERAVDDPSAGPR